MGAVQLRELLLIVLERVTELLVRIVSCRDDCRLRGSLSGDGLDCGGDGRPNVIVRRGDASAHRGGRDNGGGSGALEGAEVREDVAKNHARSVLSLVPVSGLSL